MYKEKICGMYEIVNTVNGKRYIGSSVNIKNRFSRHRSTLELGIHSNAYLQNAYYIYGAENFKYNILAVLEVEEQFPTEQRYLNAVLASGEELYNLALDVKSGMKGRTHSEETKKKMSNSLMGRAVSSETKKKLSIAHTGKEMSEEAKKKMSDSRTGKKASEETKKKLSDMRKGRVVSEETRKKISVIHKGKVVSKETRKKMSDIMTGKKRSEEVVKVLSKASKKSYSENPERAANLSIKMKEYWAKRKAEKLEVVV